MTDIVTVMLSVIIEATPFLILGTFIAIAVQKYKIFDTLLTKLPKNKFARRLCVSMLGVALPVCECGNVPLSRSLMRKGLSTAEATTFLLAAPILNPITFITTKEAFRGVPWVLPARMIGGLFVALLVGHLIGKMRGSVLTESFSKSCEPHVTKTSKKGSFSIKFATEFWNMFKLLSVGALIASLTQFLITQDSVAGLASNFLTGVLIMLALGFIISICSNVDAFFALAYAGSVQYGAIVTFLIAGPMVDIKTLSMLRTTYTKRALVYMTTLVSLLSVGIGLLLSYVG